MTQAMTALYEFYSRFGLPVYTAGFIPDNAELPYITFSAVDSGLTGQATHYVQVWYAGTDTSLPIAKAQEITGAIGDGVRFVLPTGVCVLYPGTPLIQLQAVENGTDRNICYAYINLLILSYTVEE